VRQTIHVAVSSPSGVARREVEADVFGAWAVHVVPGMWTHGRGRPKPTIGITHVPTGLRASCSGIHGSRRRLCRIARAFDRAGILIPLETVAVASGLVEMSDELRATMAAIGERMSEIAWKVKP
jgi:hypothetical protein